jgi:tetratricopeptide (TPR) repeat protein
MSSAPGLELVKPRGLSLADPYEVASNAEAMTFAAEHPCPACKRSRRYIAGDKGPQRKLGDVHYYLVGQRCACGFTSILYLVINRMLQRQKERDIRPAREALDEARTAGLIEPAELPAMLVTMQCLAFKGEVDGALVLARACLARFPDSVSARFNLGSLLLHRQAYEEAVQLLRTVVAANPSFSAGWYQLGIAYERRQAYKEAHASFQRFLRFWPAHAKAREHSAAAAARLAQREKGESAGA